MNIAVDSSGRSKALREATSTAHARLDHRIMAAEPFKNREGYGRFVLALHAFHRDIDALYTDTVLARLLPDLAQRRRLPFIIRDLADLGVELPTHDAAPVFPANVTADAPTALGWLYVAEGSNLGAAFLLKEAAKLDLSETFGARHLAGAPEGRGRQWKTFTAALDAVLLSGEEEARVIAEAETAFARVYGLVEVLLPIATEVTVGPMRPVVAIG